MERTFDIRIESAGENNGFLCWIDIDGSPVICQPNAPHLANQGNFESEEVALAWGEEHVAMMKKQDAETAAAAKAQKEKDDAQYAANLALVEQTKVLAAILDKLTNPSA